MAFTKTQVDEQMAGVIGEIYAHDNLTTQTIPNGAGYTKVINFTNSGLSQYVTADHANNKLTITRKGLYRIPFSISFTATGTNINWFGAVFVDGVEMDNIHFERKIGVSGDYGATQVEGYASVAVEDVPVDVDFRIRHDDVTSKDITVRYANLNTNRMGIGV